MGKNEKDDRVVQPFAQFIRMQNEGALHDELSEKVADLLEAVMDTQKSGTLTLTLKVDVDTKMSTPMFVITDAVKVNIPQPARPKSLFFQGEGGVIQRDHPNMRPLLDESLRVLPPHADEQVREVSR